MKSYDDKNYAWKNVAKMMESAFDEKVSNSQESVKPAKTKKEFITYRLHAKNWRERIRMAWRIFTNGKITIRILVER